MSITAKPVATPKRTSASEARAAYFEGDFERCLELCAQIRVGSVATASEVALLRARAYLRTGAPADAEHVIVQTLDRHTTLDASLTAQMLLACARIRQSDPDRGIEILDAASARSAGAHFAIRSEIAYAMGLAYWVKRDLDTAERYLAAVDSRSDIIHARALELSAWCQAARGNHRRSAEFFVLTLLRLDQCRAHDRAIVATAISSLSMAAAEFCDRELVRIVEHRSRTMEWTSGLVAHRFIMLLHQALVAEMFGKTVDAYEYALRAREAAPSPAFEASALSVASIIARNAGELNASVLFGERARETLEALDFRTMSGDERFALLAVAESCAHYAAVAAERLYAAYGGLTPVEKFAPLSGDPRLAAEETYVAGLVAEARGDRDNARACFVRAFAAFSEIGYVRRALLAAHAAYRIDGDAQMRAYIVEHIGHSDNFLRRSLNTNAPRAHGVAITHPTVATLPRAQREVVELICHGLTNKEIAHRRNVGEQTIKNMLTKHIFPTFGVSSRAALVSACLSHGSQTTGPGS